MKKFSIKFTNKIYDQKNIAEIRNLDGLLCGGCFAEYGCRINIPKGIYWMEKSRMKIKIKFKVIYK